MLKSVYQDLISRFPILRSELKSVIDVQITSFNEHNYDIEGLISLCPSEFEFCRGRLYKDNHIIMLVPKNGRVEIGSCDDLRNR